MKNLFWQKHNRLIEAFEHMGLGLDGRWILHSKEWTSLFLQILLYYKKLFPLKKKVLAVTQGLGLDQRMRQLVTVTGLSCDEIYLGKALDYTSNHELGFDDKVCIIAPREHFFLGDVIEWDWIRSAGVPIILYSFLPGVRPMDLQFSSGYESHVLKVGSFFVSVLGDRLEMKDWWEFDFEFESGLNTESYDLHAPVTKSKSYLMAKVRLASGRLLSGIWSEMINHHALWYLPDGMGSVLPFRERECQHSLEWLSLLDVTSILDIDEFWKVWSMSVPELGSVDPSHLYLSVFKVADQLDESGGEDESVNAE